jgi:hypothetical protein
LEATLFVPNISDAESSWRPLYRVEKKVVLSCFEAALANRTVAPRGDRDLLEEHVHRIEVPGFRPGKAPAEKLANILASRCFNHNEVLNRVAPVVLRLWMQSKDELRANVERSLREEGYEINPVTSSQQGFRQDWATEAFQATASRICAENEPAPSDAVELMICCLTGRAPTDAREAAQDAEAASADFDFGIWIQALRAMPEADPRWNSFQHFRKTAEEIYEEKLLLVAAAPVFKDLHANAALIQELFEFSDCESWVPSDFHPTRLEDASADITRLLLRLQVFRVPVSGSHWQQIEQLEQRKAAGSDIQDIYSRLSTDRKTELIASPPGLSEPKDLSAHSESVEATAPPSVITTLLASDDGPDYRLPRIANPDAALDRTAASIEDRSGDRILGSEVLHPLTAETKEAHGISELLGTEAAPQTESPEAHASVNQECGAIPSHVPTEIPSDSAEKDSVSEGACQFNAMESQLWCLINEGRHGLSWALADALIQSQSLLRQTLPSWLVEVVGLSQFVTSETGDVARTIEVGFSKFDEAQLLDNLQAEQATALGLLLVAASVRPALIAPRTGASRLLQAALKIVPSELYELCTAVADFGDRLQPLEPSILREVKSEAAWSERVADHQAKASEWLQKAAQSKISYAPASRVLWKWLERGQLIYSLLQPVRQDDHSKLASVRELIDRFSDAREAKKLVDETDRRVLGRRLGSPITAGALAQLQAHLENAVAIARDWVAIHEQKLGKTKGFKLGVAERIRADVARCCPASMEALSKLARRYGNSPKGCAASACAAALADVQTLFDVNRPFSTDGQNPHLLVRSELLFVPGISLNNNWEIEQTDPNERLEAIREYLLQPKFDITSTLDRLCQVEDHLATARLIEYAAYQSDPDVDKFAARRAEALLNARSALKRSAIGARREIDKAAAFSYINEAERADFTADTERIREHVDEDVRFRSRRTRIANILSTIADRRKEEIEAVQARLLQVAPNHPDQPRIAALLLAGDVITANDYVEMLRNGESLPTELNEDRDVFCDFFPKTLQKIEQLLEEDKRPQTLIDYIRAGKGFADIDMSRVPGSQAQSAADTLDLWHELKRERKITEGSVKSLLDFLGFNVLSAKITRSGRREWIDIKTDAISDRGRCPVPHFGSHARGTYRIHCFWDRPPEEDLISHVGNSAHGAASIVLYFGRMSEAKRRELARLSIRGRNTFVLLDETLLIYLCGERGSRMPVFFRCALPFTFYEPYTTTAGLLAPEMFYGRDYERRSIIDPRGSCLIYGGRQLGKTVLLRDVERNVHDRATNRIAIWLDLKAKGIGYDRPVDDLWVILAGELKGIGILPASVQVHASADLRS